VVIGLSVTWGIPGLALLIFNKPIQRRIRRLSP
jgi:hypothetical protein